MLGNLTFVVSIEAPVAPHGGGHFMCIEPQYLSPRSPVFVLIQNQVFKFCKMPAPAIVYATHGVGGKKSSKIMEALPRAWWLAPPPGSSRCVRHLARVRQPDSSCPGG